MAITWLAPLQQTHVNVACHPSLAGLSCLLLTLSWCHFSCMQYLLAADRCYSGLEAKQGGVAQALPASTTMQDSRLRGVPPGEPRPPCPLHIVVCVGRAQQRLHLQVIPGVYAHVLKTRHRRQGDVVCSVASVTKRQPSMIVHLVPGCGCATSDLYLLQFVACWLRREGLQNAPTAPAACPQASTGSHLARYFPGTTTQP